MRPILAVKRATAIDAAAVRHLTRQAYAKWVPLIGREPKPMTADYDHAVQHHLVDLLLADDTLAALIEMIPAPDHLLIENLAVSPAHQGRGYGKHLMGHAEQVAAQLGHRRIELYTNQRFAENIVLYQHLGYRIEREEQVPVGVITHMSKVI